MEETVLWKNKQLVGSVKQVLVERVENGLASGNSEDMKLTRFHTNDASLVGTIVPVKILEAFEWQLRGDLVS